MNATGHMVVARIAWDVMTPAARAEVASLVADPNNPTSHKPTTAEDSDKFTAANYMDDIRPTYGHLHFDNQYIDADNRPLDRPSESPNSVTFLEDNLHILENPSASKDEKAEALRYTMHLVGDLHQPLHNVDRVTPTLPDGDRGGNLFPIKWNSDMKESNLHGYWDSAAGEFGFIARPLTAQGQKQLDQLATTIESQFPQSTLQSRAHDLDPAHWAADGLQLAMRDCYTGIKPNEAPSDEYRKKTVQDMNEETALAGYRLGNIFNQIFDKKNAPAS